MWGPTISKNTVSRLQHMQNRAVRITCEIWKYEHVSQYRANLEWLPVPEFVQYRTNLMMFGQHYLGDFGRKHSYETRSSPKISL